MVLKNLDIRDVVSTKTWEHACVPAWKTPQWQGKAVVFPSLIAIVLGNAYVLTMCFFLAFPQD